MPTFNALLLDDRGMHWCITPNGLRLDGQWRAGTEKDCTICTASWEQVRAKSKPKRRKKISETSGVSI